MTPGPDPRPDAPGRPPRWPAVAVAAAVAVAVGFVGQGWLRVGADPQPTAVSAVLTEVTGGAGVRQPARLRVAVAVTNAGRRAVRVAGPDPGPGTVALVTSKVEVAPGRTVRVEGDAAVNCARPEAPRLPDLVLERPDGTRGRLAVAASVLLLEGCARGPARVRPLTVGIDGEPEPGPAGRLRLTFDSPTGRAATVTAVRAEGVALRTAPVRVPVGAGGPVTAWLEPPTSCPAGWRVGGLPSALSVDLAAGSMGDGVPTGAPPAGTAPPALAGPGPVAGLRVRLGGALTSWLLATACRADR